MDEPRILRPSDGGVDQTSANPLPSLPFGNHQRGDFAVGWKLQPLDPHDVNPAAECVECHGDKYGVSFGGRQGV